MMDKDLAYRLSALEKKFDTEVIKLRRERTYEKNLIDAVQKALNRFEYLDKSKDYVVASLDSAGYIKELVEVTRIIEKPQGDLKRFETGYHRIEGSEIVLDEVRKRILEDIE